MPCSRGTSAAARIFICVPGRVLLIRHFTRHPDIKTGALAEIVVENLDAGGGDPLRDEVEAFLEAVATRAPPAVSGREGLRALELAERIAASIEQGVRSV